ncbi:hypothetical protein FGG08_005912 [Glutinoglossum americanum]|uniref:Uncharacterized protein n=1 Tax=Glutinoglossum americanum TaxID=1670608 RepID=A0A9P8L1E5_9PEZI|nr:hypothetical protein FGG08_005912 [Glutinoglossum americanum]
MPRPSLRLLSSLKGVGASSSAKASQSATFPDRTNREKWHQKVKESHDALDFLVSGYPRIGAIRLEPLRRATADYLTEWKTNHLRPSVECDETLGALIDEHTRRERLTRDVAILACLYALSIPAATRHLASLMDLDVERYLRCITLVSQANPDVVSDEELRSAQSLLQILSSQGQDFQEFQHLIEALGLGAPAIFIPLPIIQSALARSGIRFHLQRQLDSHLEQKRFKSAFLLVSWLQSVPKIPNNSNIIAVLDRHFPSWPLLLAWRPNIERIGQWELGRLTLAQRKKLSHALDLDGPDNATRQRESLKMAEPECYEHVHVYPQSTETLERFLDLLYRAHILGPGALELFIHLCVDNSADETALSMVDGGIKTGDDSYCSRLFLLLQALSPQSSLSCQVDGLAKALPILNDQKTRQNAYVPTDHLADRLGSIMKAAQVTFCAQLEKGTGEYMGMLIYDLGNAILQASWIHSNLPPNILAQIRRFPPQDTLEAIFDQLQDHAESSSPEDCRFKSYLASALGGRGAVEAGSVTLAAIREEVQFWKHPPDAVRKDLSKAFAKIKSMDYSLYTTCLLGMLKEDDLFVREMRHAIMEGNEQTCLNFARYLAHRRGLSQLQRECWLLLLASLIKERGPSFLPRMAESMPSDQWLRLVDDLTYLVSPTHSRLPQFGAGLTQEMLSWWGTLSQNMTAVRFLLEGQGRRGSLGWLYFPPPLDKIMDLLDIAKQGQSMIPVHRQIVSHLAPGGNNVVIVCDCIRAIRSTSTIGRAVCERMFSRREMAERWLKSELGIVLEAWRRSEYLTQGDKSALDLIRRLLKVPSSPQLNTAGSQSAKERLQSEYDTLLDRARELEILRLRLRHQSPQRISTLLQRLGIDDTSFSRAADAGIPHELFDAVEVVGEAEYELSFALTGLSDLQRQARGISKDSRMLVVRLGPLGSSQFCIHFSPNDEGQGRHKYWRPADNREPGSTICTTRPNLFTYYLGHNLSQLLQRGCPSLQFIHLAILGLIAASPATCIVCCGSMRAKLWKPAACSKGCSLKLRNAPLEVRLHNLLVDPLSIDLLLNCVYAAAADQSNLNLLPGCPIQTTKIRAVIDSFGPLASLQAATDLRAAIRGYDVYGRDREHLLSWLCLRFRGFMMTAPDGFRIPSMPNTQQFLILNSNHTRERLFNEQQGASGVVFHGTHASRLFLVLTEGLKVLSNTAFMLNGAAAGPGIYCGDEQAASVVFAGSMDQSWSNSALGNMKIMLGCELAAYAAPLQWGAHVVTDQNKLLVRYVFLLPQTYQSPPRHHVEPAMSTAFAKLRSGLLT